MSQSTNLTRYKITSDEELLLSQWHYFNDEKYLKGELGIDQKSIINLVMTEIATGKDLREVWETIVKPGNKPGTMVEPYRYMWMANKNLATISNNNILNTFLFSLQQNNSPYNPKDVANYTRGRLEGCSIEKMRCDYWYSPHTSFIGCNFKDSTFNFWYANRAIFSHSVFDNVKIYRSNFNYADFNRTDMDRHYATRVKYLNSLFHGCDFSAINHHDCHADNNEYIECLFDDFEGGSATVIPDTTNSLFLRCKGTINTYNAIKPTVAAIFSNNKVHHCTFKSTASVPIVSTFKGQIQNNDFYGSEFEKVIFGGRLDNCSFQKTTFLNKPAFIAATVIDGCDFTDSNIGNYYTKSQIKSAVGSHNNVIWTDGAPL